MNAHIDYLRDPGGALTLDDVTALSLRNAFVPASDNLNFGLTRDTVWLKLSLERPAHAPAEWWLEVAPAYIGEITMYLVTDGQSDLRPKPSKAGILVPFSEREFKSRNNTFKIRLDADESYSVYLKLRSSYPINVRGTLWQPKSYVENASTVNIFLGLYFGAFIVIFLLCVMLWYTKRAPTDLWWIIYIVAEGFMIFRMNGLASEYLFPDSPEIISLMGVLALVTMIWAGSHFGIHAFSVDIDKNKRAYRFLKWIGNLALAVGVVRIFDASIELTIVLFLLGLSLSIFNCALSWRFFRSDLPSSNYYLVAILFMAGCTMLVLARNFGLIPAYEFIDNIWQLNMVVHTGLISLGIMFRHRETRKQRALAAEYRANADANLNLSIMHKRLVALVSHEFRNALAMVSINMHAVNKRKDLPPEIEEKHKNIIRIHQQMRRVIDDFLTEDRIDGAVFKIAYRKTDVSRLLEEAINYGKIVAKCHKFSSKILDVPEYLYLDDGIIRLALINLIDNAIKYSPPGGAISLMASFIGNKLYFQVEDNGIGMTAQSVSQLFQPYFKANEHSDGIGIGLYMVKLMLDAHGGQIRVSSKIGEGSAIEFFLTPQRIVDEIDLKDQAP